jgi:hypothetical protein
VRRCSPFWVIVAAVALAAALGLRSSDEEQVEKGLVTVAKSMGQGQAAARQAVETWADARVRLELAGDVEELARGELVGRVEQYVREHGHVVIDVASLEVHVHDGRANASGMLMISDSQVGDLHAEQRPFSTSLSRHDGWRVEALSIAVARKHIPEARP